MICDWDGCDWGAVATVVFMNQLMAPTIGYYCEAHAHIIASAYPIVASRHLVRPWNVPEPAALS